jgi:hypothetical protein
MTLFLQCNKQNIEQNFVAKALLKSGKNLAINQGPWKLFKTEGVKIVSPPHPNFRALLRFHDIVKIIVIHEVLVPYPKWWPMRVETKALVDFIASKTWTTEPETSS